MCVLVSIGVKAMVEKRFDTFEDEKEISAMIKSLQSKTIEYMTSPNAWEFETISDIKS